jgi:membrane protein implicated in regulation of membrane protease activity
MFLVYVFSLVVGGVFLGVSALLGGHGDADADGGGHEGGLHKDTGGETPTWMPFLNLQFWMFAFAFFGLTGTVVGGLGLAGDVVTAGLSAVMGLCAGLGASYAFHKLRHDPVESNVGVADFIGRNASVLLPVQRGQQGKVRVVVKGQLVDLVAATDDEQPIGPREEVLVIEMRETVAQVVRKTRAEGDET